ncbi:MAG: replication protein [Bacilli bacterium]|nr:replication protein [Bacilli bacterium]
MAIKGRNWAFVMYPESMPSNWREIITETGLPCAISPLHDQDLEPTGEKKKPHYHVICYYENPTTQKNVKENVCDRLNATIPIKLESMVGMYRYHLHLDNPEKYQYDDRFRELLNGFDVQKVNALSYTEVAKLLREIQQFIVDNDILEYADLLDLLLNNDCFNMWDVARNHTMMINTYITSRRNKARLES